MLGTFCDKFAASLSSQKAGPSPRETFMSFFLPNLLSPPLHKSHILHYSSDSSKLHPFFSTLVTLHPIKPSR